MSDDEWEVIVDPDESPLQEPERSSLSDPEPLTADESASAFQTLQARAGLVTASSLVDPDPDELDDGDFEPGAYKGFEILPPEEWPHVKAHAHISRRFYVRHNDTVGMVPWAGSKIIWPWEHAWEQDLHRETVTSYLKDDKEKKPSPRGR